MPALLDRPRRRKRTTAPTRRFVRVGRPVVPHLDALIALVLSRLPKWNAEALSRAAEYIAVALAAGQVTATDPDAEARLTRVAELGFKAGEMAELRYRRRFSTGLLTAAGSPVVDAVAAPDSTDVPLSRVARRGRASAADQEYRLREARVLAVMRDAGLSGLAAERAYDRLMAD